MNKGILALVRLSPERLAALTAAGYAVREVAKYPGRMEALRDAGDAVSAVLTNGRGGLTSAEMALLPKLELVCTAGAGYESVDLPTAQSRGIAVANCPDSNAPAVADAAMMLLLASVRHLREADIFVRGGGWQDTADRVRSAARMGSVDDEWKEEDPNVPLSPWWYTSDPARMVGMRLVRSAKPLSNELIKKFWEIDVDAIQEDVDARLKEGRGAIGISVPELIKEYQRKK